MANAKPIDQPTITDEAMYEIVDGQLVEMPPKSAYAMLVASELLGRLAEFAAKADCGQPAAHTLFRLPLTPPRDLRPDVALVTNDRWPPTRPLQMDAVSWDVVPTLVALVVSPTDFADALQTRICDFLAAGVKRVWVVYPKTRCVMAHTDNFGLSVIEEGQVLDGGDIVPGLAIPVADIFPPRDDTAPDVAITVE